MKTLFAAAAFPRRSGVPPQRFAATGDRTASLVGCPYRLVAALAVLCILQVSLFIASSHAADPPIVPRFAYVANYTSNSVSIYTVDGTTGAFRHSGYATAGTNPTTVTVDPAGKFAYVANRGSNNISVYTIDRSTGALTAGTPVAAGTNPFSVAVDPSGKFAYATNLNSNNLSVYTINQTTGALTAGTAVAAGTSPNTVTVHPSGKFAYVANEESNDVSVFTVNQTTGALTAGTTVAAGTGPTEIAVDPSGKFAYVANYLSNNVSVYTINQTTGALTAGTAVAAGTYPFSVAVDPSGKFAYVANNTSMDVSVYTINQSTGALTAGTPVATGAGPYSVTVDPSGKFAYVANLSSSDVWSYTINQTSGALTFGRAVSTQLSPISIAMAGGSAAVTYAPKFAYVANANSNNVSVYSINRTSGALTAGTAVAAGTNPGSVAVDPFGRFAYVANYSSNNVSVYTINQTTGALTAGTKVAAGTNPNSVTVDPSGRFVYVANYTSNSVSVYRINQATGALTAGTTLASQAYGPTSVAVDPSGSLAYVAHGKSAYVLSYVIDQATGALTKVTDVATKTNPTSVAVAPSGKFGYVANRSSNNVTVFTILGNGQLTAGTDVSAGTTPESVAVDPSGKFAYVANSGSNNVSVYRINQTTGALTAGTAAAAGAGSGSVAVDPSGKFAYVANANSNNVSVYTIDQSTGALTAGTAVAAGTGPFSVATSGSIVPLAVPVDGACGTSNGGTFTVAPATNLCSVGTASVVAGTGPWSWNCSGSNGGTGAGCAAAKVTDSVAPVITAFAIPATSSGPTIPITTLTATDGTGVAGYLITEGSAKPSATATGWTASAPTTFAASGAGSKTLYAWAKDAAGNVSLSATASVTITIPVNGACGTSNGGAFSAIPTAGLCTAGTAGTVTGTGPWNWSCAGVNGGTNATCSAFVATADTAPAPIPRTGQNTCHDALGAASSCAGTGQDGEFQAGVVWPNPRFLDNSVADGSDQTVTDMLTGLIWSKDINLMASRNPTFDKDKYQYDPDNDGRVTWQHALDYIKKLNAENYLGHNDWRLPNINELKSLINPGHSAPNTWAISQDFRNIDVQSNHLQYWSSTTLANAFAYAINANFNTGEVYYGPKSGYSDMSGCLHVWPMRSSPPGSFRAMTLPKTGQTTCSDQSGATISCTGTGQDGERQTGAEWPTPRFTTSADQTVTDNLTGLVWTRNGYPAAATKTWQEALDYIKSLNNQNYLGHNDWRLPNSNELSSLGSRGQSYTVNWLNGQGFTDVQGGDYYWSSTSRISDAGSKTTAWGVYLNNGIFVGYDKSGSKYVWPVRAGQPKPSGSLTLLPATTTFTATDTGTLSAPITFTLANGSTVDIAVSAVNITGTDATQFSVAAGGATPCADLTPRLAAGASCTINVTFAPTSAGAKSAALHVTSDAAGTTALDSILYGTGGADVTAPTITSFSIPSTSSTLAVSVTLAASDALGVTGYCLKETAGSTGCSWSTTAPTGHTFGGAGSKSLYAYAKDAAGNISAAGTASVTIAIPINGACGTSNGGTFTAVPTTNLCSAGTAGTVAGTGPWSWSCSGSNGGTTAGCTAAAGGSNIILNPGFESGAGGAGYWHQTSSDGYPIITTDLPGKGHNGSNGFALMGAGNNITALMYQDVALPAAATGAALDFYYQVQTKETTTTITKDALFVMVYDPPTSTTPVSTFIASNLDFTVGSNGWNLTASNVWRHYTGLELSSYKGKTIRLAFGILTDASNPSMFLVDDVSLNVTTGTVADTAPPTITTFSVPTASSILAVSVTLAASDAKGVTGYCIKETSGSTGCNWSSTPPTSHAFGSEGDKTLYAWARDAAGNVSTPASASVTVSVTHPTDDASTDQTTWQSIGPFGGMATSLAIDPADTQTVYVGTYGSGVFKTTSGGASWAVAAVGLTNKFVYSLVADPSNSRVLYAGTVKGIFKSTDGGTSWAATSSGPTWVYALAIDPGDSRVVYAGTWLGGVYKSIDGGSAWSTANSGMTSTSIESLAIDPTDGRTLYAGTDYGGVFKSADGGASWTAANSGITVGALGVNIKSLAIAPSGNRTVYAATKEGAVFRSTDGGASWVAASGGITATVESLAVDPTSSQTVYAGTPYGAVFKTTDGGASWSVANDAPVPTGTANFLNYPLAIDPANARTLYAGTVNGVIKTADGGTSWASTNNGITAGADAFAIDPTDGRTIYAGIFGGGVFKSSNGGTTWAKASTGMTDTYIESLAIDPADSRTLYAGTLSGSGIFKSVNGGASWTATGNGLTNKNVLSLAVDPRNGQSVYAGTDSGGIFKTANGGSSWTSSGNGMPGSTTVRSLAVDPADSRIVYAGTDGGVFKTVDYGASWSATGSEISSSIVYALSIDPGNGQTIHAATSTGIFKTANGGTSWAAVNNGITNRYIWSLAVDPTNSQTIYASAYKSVDSGASWRVSGGIPNTNIWSLDIDPNGNRTLYAATGLGVYKSMESGSFPLLSNPTEATFTETVAGSFPVVSSGWPSPVFSLSGTLPAGLTFDPGTGTISGTPAGGSAGTYSLIVTAANGTPPDAVRGLAVTVLPASSLSAVIGTPVKGAGRASLTAIAGTASGSGLTKVEVQVTDGAYYLQADGTFGTTGSWLAATGPNPWTLSTSSVPWREGISYTVLARAGDGGITSAPASSAFTILVPAGKTATILSLALPPDTIRAGDRAAISGNLVRTDAASPSGQAVTLIVTPPATAAAPSPAPVVVPVTTDGSGNFTSGTLSCFTLPGVYLVQARFEGTPALAASFASRAFGVTPQSGYAIIVSGKAADNSLLELHTATADTIRATMLNKRGFLPENIVYLQSTASAAVGKQQIRDAVTIWAKNKLAAAPAPLYLIMIDHGTPGGFVIGDQTLTPDDLAGWLDTLESDPAVVASGAPESYKRIVIIGTCYSGAFVPKLSKPGRVIITSAGTDEQSLAGFSIYNSATSTTYSGGEYFIDTMINFLGRGDSFKDAVVRSSSNVALRDPRKADLALHSGVYDTLAQHPLLDDDGDGTAGYLLAGTTDGVQAAELTLGVGIRTPGNPADITAVTGTTIIPPTQTGDSPLWLRVNDNSRIAKAWMEIRTPVTSISSSGATGQVIPRLLTMPLFYDGRQWNGSYTFPNAGTYNILYYTQDNRTGDISPAAHSAVYRQLADNTAPSAFSLTSPADEGSVAPMFPLTWQEVTSNNSITYTLLVAIDQNFDTIVYREEGIPQAATYIADGKLKNPANNSYYCRNGDSYCYWKVRAIDRYGAVTESGFRSFTVVATNALPALLYGYVRDNATGAPIAGARVGIAGAGAGATTLANGAYLMVVPTGSVSLSVSATGYQSRTLGNLTATAGRVLSNNISLSASGSSKPGDCNGDGSVGSAEVQSAVNMLLGLKTPLACVDKDGVGGVTIAEVQKVISSSLGL